MKRIFYLPVFTIVLLAGTYFTSCNSFAKQVESKNVQFDDNDKNQSETEFHVRRIATAHEWNDFKKDQQLKLKATELQIADLRKSIATQETAQKIDSIFQEIVELQQKNNILRAKIISYESNQTDWATFKRKVDYDIEELDKVFYNLTTDNKINN